MHNRDPPKMPNERDVAHSIPAIALPRAPHFSACRPVPLGLSNWLNMGILKDSSVSLDEQIRLIIGLLQFNKFCTSSDFFFDFF
jgi:hypothetical protein